MLPKWLTALFVLSREAWSARRDAHIRFLKLQVEMLQSRLPGNRVIPDPLERRRLMKIGAEMGHAILTNRYGVRFNTTAVKSSC